MFEIPALELNVFQQVDGGKKFWMVKLDSYDRVLLQALQEDARVPQSELGEMACLSTAAVNRRLKLLAANGVIEGFAARLNPKALGYDLTVVVQVKVENERVDLLDEMQRAFVACPQVQQCYYVAGEWDFILIFLVKSMDQYVALTRDLFFRLGNVKSFNTLVAMDPVKTGASVPIDAE